MRPTIPSPQSTDEPEVPVHIYLSRKLDEREDLTNAEVARRLGYPRPNVVAMIRTGTMRVPLSKVRAIAEMLELDPAALLQRVLSEYDPQLWTTIQDVLGDQLVTDHELRLLRLLRSRARGLDPDLAGSTTFAAGFTMLVDQCLDEQVARETAKRASPSPARVTAVMAANQKLEDLIQRQAAERIALRRKLLQGAADA